MRQFPCDWKFFHNLLSTPTAPFREKLVRDLIEKRLSQYNIPYFLDHDGNILVGADNEKKYIQELKKHSSREIPLFIAHMDHPGFHGKKWRSPFELEFTWHGGAPVEDLIGARMWCTTNEGKVIHGEMTEAELIPSGKSISHGCIRFEVKDLTKFKPSLIYGGFGFRAPYWEENGIAYSKAADDLVGCFVILELARLFAKKRPFPFFGLLSRAEEVGFVGTLAHFARGYMKNRKRNVLVVSLETSRTFPGADIGKGPVIRLGDRFTIFDAAYTHSISKLAEKVLPGEFQRRIMDGGTCEATAATVHDIPSIGFSVPLGNYHNQNFQNGPDARALNGPAPEFVHKNDVERLARIGHALIVKGVARKDAWQWKRNDLARNLKKYQKLLSTL